ncbi:MAG: hypothetical protein A2073_00110 [Deltaproteobacteria bacterium GWC2_42_11]|nr:MAG: hypothetical protein A2073_00110 [Deltaproteobacteria bacterium GWC2_42_11]HBO83608.1 phosphatidylglycerophosphatase A [Deltaproteobacteria bacterium]HBU05568.1 phosphatidylglycerophosphatase A [Nitrospiraceae bacterium]
MNKKIILLLATCFYSGYSPFAPGTVGTILGIPLGFLISKLNLINQLLLFILAFFALSYVAGRGEAFFNKKDAPQVVCDEVLGFVTAMSFIPYTFLNIAVVFFLFRLFDIWKPFPIRLIEKKINGGYGIVLDDIAAGVYANIAFRISGFFMP